MLRNCVLLVCALTAMAFAGAPVPAAEQGKVRLLHLPPEAHVYVDGRPVAAQKDALLLAPGWHEIQVETLQDRLVSACRRRLHIAARQIQTLTLTMLPVRQPAIHRGEEVLLPPGPPGAVGPARTARAKPRALFLPGRYAGVKPAAAESPAGPVGRVKRAGHRY
ncbi:MAG TPA: hypothetical protein VFB38_16060 [Chthonomonadaceae bacterium]|nr:hypothetical protein [Chthonomonadaceae bacterium]